MEKRFGYGGLFLIALGIPTTMAARRFFPFDFAFESPTLFSVLQVAATAAACGAGLMAGAVSTFARGRQPNYFPSMAASLLAMAVLSGSLAVHLHPVDGRYLMLLSTGQLLGGLFAASAWWTGRLPKVLGQGARWPSIATVTALSIVALFYGADASGFLLSNGRYGAPFLWLMNFSGALFITASIYFTRIYQREHRLSDLVFAHFTLLSGISDLCWPGLHVWGPMWWIAQGAQTFAFLLVAAYLVRLHLFLERSLEESELRFETLSNATFEGVLVLKDGRASDWNLAFAQMSGFSRNSLRGLPLSALLPGEAVEALSAGAASVTTELRGDAHQIPVEVRLRPSGDQQFVLLRDLSERRGLEREVAEKQSRLKDLFLYSTDGIAYAELDGKVLEANEAFSQLTGYSKDALAAGVAAIDVLAGGGAAPTPATAGFHREYEREYLRRDGKRICVMQTEFPVRNVDGRVTHVGILVKDITESRQSTETLRSLNEELTRSNRELDRFAAIVSHDLAEPLRTIATALRMIERKEGEQLTADARSYMAFALGAAARLQALIRGLLAYSRVHTTAGTLTDVDTNAALANVLENVRTLLDESGARVHFRALPMVRGEPELIELLFQNLVVNAVKFRRTSPPEIVVSADADGKDWVFSIADNGSGIAPEARDRIFHLFQRGQSHIPGQGIGLATCKKIVESLGGSIWVDSTPNVGSTFHFRLPAARANTEPYGHRGNSSPRPDNLVS